MIKKRLIEAGAIKFGDFTLASGKKAGYYIDIKEALTRPDILDEISEGLSEKVSADRIAGVELGAVPLLIAASMRLKIPYIIVRKEKKPHGTEKLFIGDVQPGENINILEDVVTTGNSVLRAAEMLIDRGAKVSKVICVVDREEGGEELLKANGIELVHLMRASELLTDNVHK